MLMRRRVAFAVGCVALVVSTVSAQVSHVAPAGAPSNGRLAPASEPGPPLAVSGDDNPFVSRGGVKLRGALDAFVISSTYEGTPLALFEAMAAGKAIVSTAVDGCREVLEDGRTGLLVPPRDPAALAEALGRVADDGGLRRALGEDARAASSRYDIRECVAAMEALYDEVLAEKGRA